MGGGDSSSRRIEAAQFASEISPIWGGGFQLKQIIKGRVQSLQQQQQQQRASAADETRPKGAGVDLDRQAGWWSIDLIDIEVASTLCCQPHPVSGG